MSKIALALAELHRSEGALARELRRVAARHHSDQDISHLADDLARWSEEHVQLLAEHGRHYRLHLSRRTRRLRVSRWIQEQLSAAMRRRPEPALLLLADLRRVHRDAAGVSLDWELLSQGAQATKDHELLTLTERCHPQTLRQMRWANAMLKELSPQALSS
ncbi:hypothetical protein A5733_09685 [Mycobacterium sp. NS-7484]|uniref:hypothetical protein n=1 Tax=unclassified Mycobacterium TaxID=2642494 RepID=UPI0007FC0E9D|nr:MULTISPECIES: hypothetical protein [unclassified Mycobacterium]OBG83473.1 hypothetical protein A5699_04235 [Mycobacterium sp. E802]OMB97484.1 hypothetical protein A5733_09685 [Mycobacterium sp. NS-7484]